LLLGCKKAISDRSEAVCCSCASVGDHGCMKYLTPPVSGVRQGQGLDVEKEPFLTVGYSFRDIKICHA
jgi:hypothetical protein